MSFNMYASDCVYSIDFRINYKNDENTIVQNFENKGPWQMKGSGPYKEPLNLKAGSNIVRIDLDQDFYHASVNGKRRNEIVDMRTPKLDNFKNMRLFGLDSGCITIDMEKSFIDWSRVE